MNIWYILQVLLSALPPTLSLVFLIMDRQNKRRPK
jgi:hypothetical protein